MQNPIAVASSATETATFRLVAKASHTSGSENAFWYQWKVKLPSGMLGNRSELNENTTLAMIGAKTNRNTAPR